MRDVMGVKQESLAADLRISQQAVSALEQKEVLDPPLLERISVILGVPEETITHMTDDGILNVFANTLNSHDASISNQFNFSPVEKIIELYERMLQAEREKNEVLKQLLDSRK